MIYGNMLNTKITGQTVSSSAVTRGAAKHALNVVMIAVPWKTSEEEY